ncbi:MAG: DnaD domain protein, partial [Clostridiaceae bacterium]|nr:DnaD domain protein [Clostridiaceae bacterium]
LAYSEYEPSWIMDALKETAVQNKRSWAYTEAILKRWQKEGRNSKRAPVKADERSADTFRQYRKAAQ